MTDDLPPAAAPTAPVQPVMTARPMTKIFSEWAVDIAWPGGHKDTVNGFRDEAHARGWIKHESAAWIARLRGPRH